MIDFKLFFEPLKGDIVYNKNRRCGVCGKHPQDPKHSLKTCKSKTPPSDGVNRGARL